ncbi:DUF4270 domain-containing protein [Lentimicrobium saccharophilum]|uniref:DUF4270 domain-containing protein n=1 Tax=Lentimicrobium saccharophilum TaxID=1678841 RepID=UPI001F2D12E9|nr:DUF4270 domain-containing protein [Lentimicrobium saccharophilum]
MHKLSFNRAILAIIFALSITSCNKEPDLIGIDLLPDSDYLNLSFTDTSTIIAYTVREDSLRTDELSANLLGYMNDPVFGNVLASIYTQFRLPTNNVTFGENPVADSIVLTLKYSGIYGDSLSQHTVRVFELADSINVDSSYYSHNTVPVIPQQIGEAVFVPNLVEADSVDGAFVAPHLRITLTQAFAEKIMTAGEETLSSNAYFLEVFKGLHITVDPFTTTATGSILSFDLVDDLSRITIHYHNDTDTTSIRLPINASCARFNNYEHFNYSGADPELLQQLAGDTTAGANRIFLQAMAGTKVKLRIPYLKNIPENARIAVNEALLIFTNDDPGSSLPPPTQLAIRALSSTGAYVVLPDENIGSAYFGGKYINNSEYRFRLTKYVQDRMRYPEAEDHGLMMVIAGSSLTANRAVIKGPASSNNRVKLVIYYTLVE